MKPNRDRTACECAEGYVLDREGRCVTKTERCADGYVFENGVCKAIPKCPPRSKWNQDKLRCDCSVGGEYMINNVCTACKENEGWNGK